MKPYPFVPGMVITVLVIVVTGALVWALYAFA
jgi:hypothetical protein